MEKPVNNSKASWHHENGLMAVRLKKLYFMTPLPFIPPKTFAKCFCMCVLGKCTSTAEEPDAYGPLDYVLSRAISRRRVVTLTSFLRLFRLSFVAGILFLLSLFVISQRSECSVDFPTVFFLEVFISPRGSFPFFFSSTFKFANSVLFSYLAALRAYSICLLYE